MEIEYVDAPTPVRKLSQLKLAQTFMYENEVCINLGKSEYKRGTLYSYLIVGECPEIVFEDDIEVMPVNTKLLVEI